MTHGNDDDHKPQFKFSTYKKSSVVPAINEAETLQEACTEIEEFFSMHRNVAYVKDLVGESELKHFGSGKQCLLAMFLYQEGHQLESSPLLVGDFKTSMGETHVDYNKYLRGSVFNFQLGNDVYSLIMDHLKTNFNRGLFKKLLAHIIINSDYLPTELATNIAEFVRQTNMPLVLIEFANLLSKSNITVNLGAMLVLTEPLTNYSETTKDVYIIYRRFMDKGGWEPSLQPLVGYSRKLVRADMNDYLTFMVEDIRALANSQKFKTPEKSVTSEDLKKQQNEFKLQVKTEEMKTVLEAANVLGLAGSYEKASSLFDEYREYKGTLNKEELKIGYGSYTMQPEKLAELLEMTRSNKEFIAVDTFVKLMIVIKRHPRNRILLDKILDLFLYSGPVQNSLTARNVNDIVEAFLKAKKYPCSDSAQPHTPGFLSIYLSTS